MNDDRGFRLNPETGYFENMGVTVMAFNDIYAAGHQSGVCLIMHGNRVGTNGDLRLEQTPGQWQPLPRAVERKVDAENHCITTTLEYPDERWHLKGFNPMIYPDVHLKYDVHVKAEGQAIRVWVDLETPVPEFLLGKCCFNLELFPGALFGKPWVMDDKQGIFPRQPIGPTLSLPANCDHALPADKESKLLADKAHLMGEGYSPITADTLIAAPYAAGKRFTVRPDDPYNRFTVASQSGEIKFYDGRMNHNNGWFVLSEEIKAGAAAKAVEWLITPSVVEEWLYTPVVQVSQVGYLPGQDKAVVIELDKRDERRPDIVLQKITAEGTFPVRTLKAEEWGGFLRYHYLKADFTDVTEEGLYQVKYGASASSVFRIAGDVLDRGVWQPVLEYFLPVQMCHMRVTEKYRVWHDLCHDDDATMAPVNLYHFDGYMQGEDTLCKYRPGDHVPGLNVGGWHDAGDFDLRVESQAGESYILSLIYETFGLEWDATTIDQQKKITEIHQPDGKNDLLQQIEHGALTVIAGWKALGRLYRGIICNSLRQYVLLGDPASRCFVKDICTLFSNFCCRQYKALSSDSSITHEINRNQPSPSVAGAGRLILLMRAGMGSSLMGCKHLRQIAYVGRSTGVDARMLLLNHLLAERWFVQAAERIDSLCGHAGCEAHAVRFKVGAVPGFTAGNGRDVYQRDAHDCRLGGSQAARLGKQHVAGAHVRGHLFRPAHKDELFAVLLLQAVVKLCVAAADDN